MPVCSTCDHANRLGIAPDTLVHPLDGRHGMHDDFGNAQCSKCGSLWKRKADTRRIEFMIPGVNGKRPPVPRADKVMGSDIG
jgi:hypothetical protein